MENGRYNGLPMAFIFVLLINPLLSQLLRPDKMDIGSYNSETRRYEKTNQLHEVGHDDKKYDSVVPVELDDIHTNLIGGDDHDYKSHKKSLGRGDHDYKQHKLIGGGDHDYKAYDHVYGKNDHDLKTHKKPLGRGDHDYKQHKLIGGDDHDYKAYDHVYGKNDHDLKTHKKPLGRGDHDHKRHKLIGGDDHDYKAYDHVSGKNDHDLKTHQKPLGHGDHDYKQHKLIGGDDHDYKAYDHVYGKNDHDLKTHKKPLGHGDHDYKQHKKVMGGEHDKKFHKKAFGRDDHDYTNKNAFGQGKHDNVEHVRPFGRGTHDYIPHKKSLGRDHDKRQHMKAMLKHKLIKSIFDDNQQGKKGRRTKSHLTKFHRFTKKFNKFYENPQELKTRFQIFKDNIKKAKVLQQTEHGTAKYGITKFSDLTSEEFRQMLGLRPDKKPATSYLKQANLNEIANIESIPDEFDWRSKNIVTPVKNQGMCGSCWAFSVTGNVEGQYAIKHGKLLSFSEQELIDCDDLDSGCNGGLPENAYHAIEHLGGLETEKAYPYEGKDDECQFDPKKLKVRVNGSVELPENEDQLQKWLYKDGPISIGINANMLQFYVGGVSHPPKLLCNPKDLDHGVLIVGYGVHTTKYLHRHQPYWLIKNSWGEDWGEKGYFRVFRGDGTCGVNLMATSSEVL